MKEIVIKSKIVGRGTETGPGRSVASIDLSAYALKSDLLKLETSFNDFLQGEDTDDVINRWKELETFLGGISESYNLLSILQGKADKATTLSGYGITDAYTKTNVDDLLKSYVTLAGSQTITGEKNFTGGLKVNGSPIVYDATKKYWKLEGDLLVTGGITMYGNEGTYTPSTIMDAISVDGTTISKSGGVLKVIGGTGGGVADSVAWANITGKPTFASVATSGKYSDLSGKPTLLSSFTDDVVSGKYLPLSGGTLTSSGNPLAIKRTDSSAPGLVFYHNDTLLGSLGIKDDGTPYVYSAQAGSIYNMWHNGNDGSGSGLDADLLDGIQSSGYGQYVDNLTINLNDARDGFRGGKLYNATNAYDTTDAAYRGFLEYGSSGYRAQFNSSSSNNLYYRWCEANTWKPWRKFAFEDSNVASATKLQTARTIWGQSFDGTGNVSGNLIGSNFGIYDVSGNPYIKFSSGGVSTLMQMLTTGALSLGSSYTHFVITQEGNVGFGTTTPTTSIDIKGKSMEVGESVYGSGGVGSEIYMSTHREGSTLCARGMRMYVSGSTTGYFQSFAIDAKNYGTLTNIMSINSSGNLLVVGGITMYSDQRKKTILNHVELSLKQIAEAPLIEHYYNSDENKTTHVGSIAQYWYSLNNWFCKKDSEGFLTMEIQNAALASAISIARELDRYETKTDKAIKKLKKRICELEEEVERLKSA